MGTTDDKTIHRVTVEASEIVAGTVDLKVSFSNPVTRTYIEKRYRLFRGDSVDLDYHAPEHDPNISVGAQ
jgi:hypothetical protein